MKEDRVRRLFALDRKAAFITGGYRGIGLTIAETYAEAGAAIALAARNLQACEAEARRLEAALGVRAIAKFLDVRDSKGVDRVVEEVAKELGSIDILVNSAGIPGSEKPVMEMSDGDIDDVMAVDFRGTFLVCRAVARIMAKQKGGKIINVASVLGKVATRNMSAYCAGKAAVIQLTRVLALELMPNNIQVNALCPGYFRTEFNRSFFESDTGSAFIKRLIPLNRVGELEELKSAALYLATCAPFATGSEIYVDGGHSIA